MKNAVKNLQAAAYNGARTVYKMCLKVILFKGIFELFLKWRNVEVAKIGPIFTKQGGSKIEVIKEC